MKKNTIIVGLLTLISLILGFGRESLIAFLFGSTEYTDAYYVAMIVPDIVAGWIGFTITNALIPVLKKESDRSASLGIRLTNTVFVLVVLVSTLLALLSYVYVGQIIGYLAPSFDVVQTDMGIRLLRIMVVAIIFSAVSGLFAGINNTFEQYLFPSLVGVFYNLFFFIALFAFHRWLGIYALAYGLLAGVMGRVLIQSIPMIKQRRIAFQHGLGHPSMSLILKAMIPIFLSQALSQVNQVVDRILASGLPFGQITNLNYASKLGLLPTGLIGGTVATTMYIRFVKSHNTGDYGQMGSLYLKGLTWILFVGLLISGGLFFYGDSLVSILYFHGKFTVSDLLLTTDLLKLYGIFCFLYMMLPLSMQFFYSFHGGRLIIISSIVTVVLNVTLGYILVRAWGVRGLVIANGCSQTANFLILYYMAMRKARFNPLVKALGLIKNLVPGIVLVSIPLLVVSFVFPFYVSSEKWIQLLRGGTAVFSTGIIFLLFAGLFKNNPVTTTFIRAVHDGKERLLRKKTKKKVPAL